MNQDRAKQGRSPIQLDAGLSSKAQVQLKLPKFLRTIVQIKSHGIQFLLTKDLKQAYAGENIAKKSFAYEVGTDELASVFLSYGKIVKVTIKI